MNQIGNCLECEDCLYIGDGDSICQDTSRLVLDDWAPTEHFGQCQMPHDVKTKTPDKRPANKEETGEH